MPRPVSVLVTVPPFVADWSERLYANHGRVFIVDVRFEVNACRDPDTLGRCRSRPATPSSGACPWSARRRRFSSSSTRNGGRERFWALRSRSLPEGFALEFTGGLEAHVEVVEREPPTRMAIRYFGSRAEFDLVRRDDGGCLFEVRCYRDDQAEWMEFYPGWVSWLLVLKAAADFAVDLRNGADDRTWTQRFVDQ
jgi:hypothetical protein